ncbi:TM2 domain-containing protein [Bernardetia sp.]|uniref:TM2 domain-containing protein n=1 Tax=Bernardetia sp. TaxID=1937974 RepID=UPI0025BE0CEB|nr:TM2 domain-containing protein [Bernardetia sp.]
MQEQKVDMFITANKKFLAQDQIFQIRERLLEMDDSQWGIVQSVQFQDPVIVLVVALFGGGLLGIDRFMIGDIILGAFKLLTCGGFIVGAFIDILLIMSATRKKNTAKLQQIIY